MSKKKITDLEKVPKRVGSTKPIDLKLDNPRFEPGEFLQSKATLSICKKRERFLAELMEYAFRYQEGDWGELCIYDRDRNERAIKYNGEIFAMYKTSEGVVLYFTPYHRKYTAIMFETEYMKFFGLKE